VAAKKAVKVPMEVEYPPAWLTWVASTTGCLRALGVDCDQVDVAAHSGYAFLMNVPEGLCPSGPTAFDWGALHRGLALLGRSTLVYSGGECSAGKEKPEHVRLQCRAAYDIVAREMGEGRPCVL
jgi:hypothetical protein